jgi:hypothetical protein
MRCGAPAVLGKTTLKEIDLPDVGDHVIHFIGRMGPRARSGG